MVMGSMPTPVSQINLIYDICAFSSNIQSGNATFCELHAFIVDLESSNFIFGVICLQESWLNANDDID